VTKSAKHLLVASTEAHSGKSATILGLIHLALQQQITVAYGKPLGNCLSEDGCEDIVDKDLELLANLLGLPTDRVQLPLLSLNREIIDRRLRGENTEDYSQTLKEYVNHREEDLVVLEGPGNLWEGSLFNLSVPEIAEITDAAILLVVSYDSLLMAAGLMAAKKFLGDRLLGVTINNVSADRWEEAQNTVKPYLESHDIPVLGIVPRNSLLNSVSVRELAKRLQAKVLCCAEHLDWMVESLSIGAMNVNSALGFFRQRENMAVITGGDRTELQMAALETSTHCLILTGRTPPQPLIISRAEDLDIPIIAVDSDTLTTVEIVDSAFGSVPISEPIKVEQARSLIAQHFEIDRLLKFLGLESAISV
jgi:uncharacterized protein